MDDLLERIADVEVQCTDCDWLGQLWETHLSVTERGVDCCPWCFAPVETREL